MYDRLKEIMYQKHYTQHSLASAIGVSEGQLSHKMAGHYPFKQKDIRSICDKLEISPSEIGEIFFAE